MSLQEVPWSPHIAANRYWGGQSMDLNKMKINIFVEMLCCLLDLGSINSPLDSFIHMGHRLSTTTHHPRTTKKSTACQQTCDVSTTSLTSLGIPTYGAGWVLLSRRNPPSVCGKHISLNNDDHRSCGHPLLHPSCPRPILFDHLWHLRLLRTKCCFTRVSH